jgi:hypothetical protein
VLLALAAVVIAQLAFTYAPFMQELFDTRPIAFADGIVIAGAGVLLMVILEMEKIILRRLQIFDGLDPEVVTVDPHQPATRKAG